MIVLNSVPLRISLLGGGSDMPEFWGNGHVGACLSFSIDKCVHAVVETSDTLFVGKDAEGPITDLILKRLVRFCSAHSLPEPRVRIDSRSDIPTRGTGMGSSSAWTVALIGALEILYPGFLVSMWKNDETPFSVAEIAYEIERTAGFKCGKQDHYAAVTAGARLFSFYRDSVKTMALPTPKIGSQFKAAGLLVYIGGSHDSGVILAEQAERVGKVGKSIDDLKRMSDLARIGAFHFGADDVASLSECLKEAWDIKKRFASSVVDDKIQGIYDFSMANGALGGKILGAGGAGFMYFQCYSSANAAFLAGLLKEHGCHKVNFQVLDTYPETIVTPGERA